MSHSAVVVPRWFFLLHCFALFFMPIYEGSIVCDAPCLCDIGGLDLEAKNLPRQPLTIML